MRRKHHPQADAPSQPETPLTDYPSPLVSRLPVLLPAFVLGIAAVIVLAPAAAAREGDQDDDGLWDRFEVRWGVTDPDQRDTDRDGIRDGNEDEDGDRLSNLGEQRFRTDPTDADSDDDGTRDGGEDSNGNGTDDALDQDRRPVPADLVPSLSEAFWDVPPSYSNGCHTGADSAVIHPCVYGPEDGDVRVALFGDSHALQWLPALERAGQWQGWRVTTLTKTACPSVDVVFAEGTTIGDNARPCRRWRASALDWLGEHPQDVVIITNAGRYPLVDGTGERVYGAAKEPLWQAGLSRVIDALPEDTRAVVLADTPHLRKNPVTCLKQDDVTLADCATRRGRSLAPQHDDAERRAAEAAGAVFGDLNDVVCSYDPCPIVSGDTLMWRNESHLTATYARQLAPAIRDLVAGALAADSFVPGDATRATAGRHVRISAHDDRYEPALIEAAPGEELIVTLTNEGREKHGIGFYETAGGPPIEEGAIGPIVDPGSSATLALTAPREGEYVFLDDGHPESLRGVLVVHAPGER